MVVHIVLFVVLFGEGVFGCGPPCLYLTNVSSIFRLPLNSSSGLPTTNKPDIIFRSTGHIRAIEVDAVNQLLYWGDFRYNTINRSSLDGSERATLFSYAIGHAQGLAVDWSSNILYWTDSLMKVLELSDTNGLHRKVLFKFDDGDQPRAIFVNPGHGYLFWSDWGDQPKIERSSLSGDNRISIVTTNLRWPNDLAIDYTLNRIYWIDAYLNVLESASFDGRNRKTNYKMSYNGGRIHPYSMAYLVQKDFAFVTDWYTDSVYVVGNKTVLPESKLLFRNLNNNKNIGQVRIFGNIESMNVSKPCLSNNCSHLCLKASKYTHVCACPTGMTISTTTPNQCVDVNKDYEIYFADSYAKSVNHLVKYESQNGFSIRPLVVSSNASMSYPVALDYDPLEKYIYWTDRKTKKTYRMRDDHSNYEVILTSKDGASYGLAIDEISKTMFWFDNNGKKLIMSSLDGKQRKTILDTGLDAPRDIALYKEMGYIYFTETKHKYIGRINTDATGFISLRGTESTAIYATGLAVDKIEGRIYWCDPDRYSIESTDLNFENRRKIVQKTVYVAGRFWLVENYGSVVQPFSLAILGEKLLWTDTYRRAIYTADKRSGGNVEYVTGGLDHPRDIHVYRKHFKTEHRKIYTFSVLKSLLTTGSAKCFSSSSCSSRMRSYIPDPKPCPTGYKQSKMDTVCANCSDPFGGNFKCPCTNWKTCAQRAYLNIRGCKTYMPFMKFKVRECVQEVKPGMCPYKEAKTCVAYENQCKSDADCTGDKKCCKAECGSKCTNVIQKTDHPCTINNGECSHFCLAKSNAYECACPDGMDLDAAGIICKKSNETVVKDICALPKDNGPCHSSSSVTKWYFNAKTKACEQFKYGGCGGNKNKFDTREQCEHICSGTCSSIKNVTGTCDMKDNPCTTTSQCAGKELCCTQACGGKTCQVPVPKYLPKCFLPAVQGKCKASIPSWYFDFATKQCRNFTYGGCGGNENRFNDELSCYKACSSHVCNQPKQVGSCSAAIPRYYYNNRTAKCESFNWGGCLSNDNNFLTLAHCKSYCQLDSPNGCQSNPCKNGGTCTSTGRFGFDFKCTCLMKWLGKDCTLNSDKGKVIVKFRKEDGGKKVDKEALARVIAYYFLLNCMGGNCTFINTMTRRRRLSMPATVYVFRQDDVLFYEYNDEDKNILSATILILKPSHIITEPTGYLTQDSVKYGFSRYGKYIAKSVGLEYDSVAIPLPVAQTEKRSGKKKPTMKILTTLFLVLLTLAFIVFLIWYVKKRKARQLKRNTNEPAAGVTNNTSVHWSFENQLYDDIQASAVTLPPAYNEANANAGAGATTGGEQVEEKHSVGNDWVKFESEEKAPITDFVEARLPDPYDAEAVLGDPPPDYTSRAGTPAFTQRNMTTHLGELPGYTSQPSLTDLPSDQPISIATAANLSGNHATTGDTPSIHIDVSGNASS